MNKQLELFNDIPKSKITWENVSMIGDNKDYRYLLRSEGHNPLVVIGVNPSTANESTPDATMRKVMGFAEYNGFDSFIMANLYPQRTTDPNGLDEFCNHTVKWRNTLAIRRTLFALKNRPTILCAWGNLITKRSYLTLCLMNIAESVANLSPKYMCIKTTKAGHPVHPLYQKYCKLHDFDINHYISKVL